MPTLTHAITRSCVHLLVGPAPEEYSNSGRLKNTGKTREEILATKDEIFDEMSGDMEAMIR